MKTCASLQFPCFLKKTICRFALLSSLFFPSAIIAVESKPNIVYFMSDDMGYADAGFMGATDLKTPELDKYAKQGAVLETLYGQPVCSPSRASFMTGRYPTRTGVYNTVQYRSPAPWSLPLSERTLAQTLKAAGYTTAIVGKWHLGDETPAHMPTQRGFDHQYGLMGGGINSFTHIGGAQKKSSKATDWYRDDKPHPEEGYSMHLIAKDACQVIADQPADKPLFLFVAPNATHTPWVSPEEYEKPFSDLDSGRRKLAGMNSAMDEAFGQIMDALEEKGIADNTLVVFSSDNGGTSWDNTVDNGPLRGGKSDIYEGAFRLCSFAWWPGRIPAGTRIGEPLHLIDWYPTFAELAGASTEQELPIDGKDIWPVLSEGAKSPHEEIFLMGSRPTQMAIRVGDWKLLVNPEEFRGKKKSEPVELYNLARDEGEQNNLAAGNPERVAEMQKRLQPYLEGAANGGFLELPAESGSGKGGGE